jgi:hypothetical protein
MTYGVGGISTKIRISARTLLELLSGKLKHEGFLKQYGFVATEDSPQRRHNPFEYYYSKGALISSIVFEKSELDDDDTVTIILRGPDPAISPFQVPKENKDS